MEDFNYNLSREEHYEKALFYKNSNIDLYFAYLTQSANYGYDKAISLLENEYYANDYMIQSFSLNLIEFYKKTADMDLPYSLFHLGIAYMHELGLEQDYKIAYNLFEKVAENGNTFALYQLGYMYEHGIGVKQDYKKAWELYELAAKKGNIYAMNGLRDMCQNGLGVEKNYEEAYKWYKKAAEGGNTNAMNKLGYMYEHGEGVKQNYKKAYEWYKKAAEKGNFIAMNNLGTMYHKGCGVEKNNKKACEWYTKAIEKDNPIAMYNLGNLYYSDEKKYEEAYKWFNKSAEKGDTDAMDILAHMCEHGEGVEKNYEKASKLRYDLKQYDKCSSIIKKCAENEILTDNILDILCKMNKEDISDMFLKNIKSIYDPKIRLLENHFKHRPNGKGFQESKEDFYNKSKEY